ncbi:MAG: FHA domain-containing protein, partial [Anaerolineaceae bacterium]|nr:FHA domain-containing protein [Anaerolineaceae bacterium]
GNLERILDRQTMSTLTQVLSKTIDNDIQIAENGEKIAPDFFVIKVSQELYDYLTSHLDLLEDITSEIYQAGLESGYKFSAYPRLRVELASNLNSIEIDIKGTITSLPKPMTHTEVLQTPQLDSDPPQVPQNAFLVVNGKSTYPLSKVIVNIGRLSTSEIRLDDIHVSRKHIQLRAVDGNYMLFDLGSVGGTLVNGQSYNTVKLIPGDVIKIGNTTLIYFQDKNDQIHTTTKFEPNGIEK